MTQQTPILSSLFFSHLSPPCLFGRVSVRFVPLVLLFYRLIRVVLY